MLWTRALLAAAILAAGGLLRWRQAAEVASQAEAARTPPAPLASIALELPNWAGTEATPDPTLNRSTGATDAITRRYQDKRTGVVVEVIVLYGPPGEMHIHAPEVCYPAAGYASLAAARGVDRPVTPAPNPVAGTAGTADPIPFRALLYAKGTAGTTEVQEVYYCWRLGGHWTLDPGQFKRIERIAGMYKIQVGRLVRPNELVGVRLTGKDAGNPCEQFLAEFLPAFAARQAVPAPTSAPSPSAALATAD